MVTYGKDNEKEIQLQEASAKSKDLLLKGGLIVAAVIILWKMI